MRPRLPEDAQLCELSALCSFPGAAAQAGPSRTPGCRIGSLTIGAAVIWSFDDCKISYERWHPSRWMSQPPPPPRDGLSGQWKLQCMPTALQ